MDIAYIALEDVRIVAHIAVACRQQGSPGPTWRTVKTRFGKRPRSDRGPPVQYWEEGYSGSRPTTPSGLMHAYLQRRRDQLWRPFEDPWELGAILRAADHRLGRDALLAWGSYLDSAHPALKVVKARFGLSETWPA